MNRASIPVSAIPDDLRERDQWVLWRIVERDGKTTKVPFSIDGSPAKSNDKTTWTDFSSAIDTFEATTGYAGIGFAFADGGGIVGIDLDGCRDPRTGTVCEWAIEIMQKFRTYAEISPSGTGVKLFCRGKSPLSSGKKVNVNAEMIVDKAPAIEVYDKLRYFAVTGLVMYGYEQIVDGTEALGWLVSKYFPAPATNGHAANGHAPKAHTNGQHYASDATVADRARKYVSKMPAAISGQSGHNATFRVACVLVLGFGLPEDVALDILREFNARCQPPWSDKELEHKVASAAKQSGERGFLRQAQPEQWANIRIPDYREPAASGMAPKKRLKFMTSMEFMSMDFKPTWYIRNILVKGQPGVIGASKKTLKTSIALDAAISLATGTAFLGAFGVDYPTPVGMVSGESGGHVLQETAKRIIESRGGEMDLSLLHWSLDIPQLANMDDMNELGEWIAANKLEVVFIDPLYLALLSGVQDLQASNLYQIGPLLRQVAATALDRGCTPVLLHHFRMHSGREKFDHPQLGDLAFSGISEFARQWILLGRREEYVPGTGQHKLWLTVGGSAGHSGLWALDVDEGVLKDDFTGRHWSVNVQTVGEVVATKTQKAKADRNQKAEEREQGWETRLLTALDSLAGEDGYVTYTRVRDAAGLNNNQMARAVFRLAQAGIIEEVTRSVGFGRNGAARDTKSIRRTQSDA